MRALEGFNDAWLHPAQGLPSLPSFPVYTSKRGSRPVILLHELPGMTPECVKLARNLATHGFKVHMPLLFGEADAPGAAKRNLVRICISAQMRQLFFSGGTEPAGLTQWIWSLMDRLTIEAKTPLAVIGMCFTGGFALAGIAHDRGVAAVCSQPSLPLFRIFGKHSTELLGATGLATALSRSKALGKCILAMRYLTDTISTENHIRNIADAFGANCEARCLPAAERKHALLTESFSDEAYSDMIEFLDAAFEKKLA